ncbi:MAG: glycerol-3-phosphate 1-O-acyltransferase PlsY [Halothiobacillaceae bacterium]|nr:glycerol-3-phosphate 1-O-acyltransferase PlsY [Halothiobacillaceae bacterium]
MTWLNFALPIGAYLLGSIATAVVVSRLFGLPDPRTIGSGNPGATNVLRTGNKLAALATLIGDLLKGLIPVVIARALDASELVIALTALAAFIGHIFPVFFQFKGGKGVATALGVLLGLSPWLGLGTLAVWLAMAFGLRYSSLAALTAALSAPLIAWLLHLDDMILLAIAIMSALLIWRHVGNIQRLLQGQETRIGEKKAAAESTASQTSGDN